MAKTPLRIFLSHKLESSSKARMVKGAISAFGLDRVIITASCDFSTGSTWEPKIREELDRSEWLILLYDGPDINHDWCIFETGIFRGKMPSTGGRRRLICLHDPRHSLPHPLLSFKPLPAKTDELLELFKDIYTRPPWNIKPSLLDHKEQLDDQIKRIVAEVTGGVVLQSVTTISPSFVFHIKTEALRGLKKGVIPDDTYVDGDGGWETIFGKPINTVSWFWGDLTKGLLDAAPWIHLVALMMSEAERIKAVTYPSIVIRVKCLNDDEQVVYRLILRRVEVTAAESRFFFAASRVVTAFDPSSCAQETLIFHMYTMAWFFRRRFIEKHLVELDALCTAKPQSIPRIERAIETISSDMKAMWADAQVRGLENQSEIIRAFDHRWQPSIRKALQDDWPPLAVELSDLLERGIAEACEICEVIRRMTSVNQVILEACLAELPNYLPADQPAPTDVPSTRRGSSTKTPRKNGSKPTSASERKRGRKRG